MIRGPNRRWITSLFLLITLVSSSVSGQPPASLGRFDTLTLTAAAPEREFLVLEPVPITLALENRTTRGVRGHLALEFFAQRVELVIQPDGAAPYGVDELSTRRGVLLDIQPRIIKPGERRELTQLFDLGLDEWLPRPGRYSVHAVLHGSSPREELRSNSVSIVVRGWDRFEREAYDYILEAGTGFARYIFTARAQADLRPQLEELAERFGQTLYGDYANLLLGEYHGANGDAVSARKYLSRIAGKREFPLAERAATRLSRLSSR